MAVLRLVRPDAAPTLGEAAAAFLDGRDLAASSRRSYGLTLAAIVERVGPDTPLAVLDGRQLAAAHGAAYVNVAPATWNRTVATLSSFTRWCADQGWLDDDQARRLTRPLEHRRVHADHSRALPYERLDRLWRRDDVPLREKTLWRLLYETAARAAEVLALNVEDLDLANKRAQAVRKGGDRDVLCFQSGAARLLPRLLAGRRYGPIFLASQPPDPGRMPANLDLCPITGRARLSYRRAAELFKAYSGGATLHQLRHSAITHLAEANVELPLLMAKSRHASIRSVQRYAKPSIEAIAALTAAHDRNARRAT